MKTCQCGEIFGQRCKRTMRKGVATMFLCPDMRGTADACGSARCLENQLWLHRYCYSEARSVYPRFIRQARQWEMA